MKREERISEKWMEMKEDAIEEEMKLKKEKIREAYERRWK